MGSAPMLNREVDADSLPHRVRILLGHTQAPEPRDRRKPCAPRRPVAINLRPALRIAELGIGNRSIADESTFQSARDCYMVSKNARRRQKRSNRSSSPHQRSLDCQNADRRHLGDRAYILCGSQEGFFRRQFNPLHDRTNRSKALSKGYRGLAESSDGNLSFSGPTMVRQYENWCFRLREGS